MDYNIYSSSRDAFLDAVNAKDYIQLERISTIYQSLKDSVKKPLKMVLLYGKPGTGKSMFLSKLYEDLSASKRVFLYSTPILNESEFFKTLARSLFNLRYNGELSFNQFLSLLKERNFKETPLILLDEAQLYSSEQMEKIRLLADTRKVKFVITLHKTEREDLVAKEHFKTRIWETIELENASETELKLYIQKKLMKANCFEEATIFTDKSVKLIYKITKGNYRDTNKLLYTTFEIYMWYSQNKPSKINSRKISTKILEMAAIHTGLLNA